MPREDERSWLDELSPQEFDEYERRFRWVAEQARPEQLTPEGDWKTWLLLAGRRFGKTRAAAEDVAWYGLQHPKSNIAVVAETFSDGRDICIEGESGLLGVLPDSSVRHWNRSIGELFLHNGTKYRLFSGDKPRGLRGYGHHRAWTDELAKFEYPDETWDQLQFGLSAGENPQNIVTTTPRPIELVRELVERDNVVVTSGSTFDNAANLTGSFLEEVRLRYEGTPLGDQELYGQIVLLDGESIFNREFFPRYTKLQAPAMWNATRQRFIGVDTAETVGQTSAYSALVVGDIQKNYQMPIRYVARKKLEFPDLVDWVVQECSFFRDDFKLEAVLIENASSGRQLIQQLRKSGPAWLAHRVVAVPPNPGPNGKEAGWKNAALWAKRQMTPLPEVGDDAPGSEWLYDFERELFSVPNATFKDQADAYSILVNGVEQRTHAFSSRWRTLMNRQSVASA